MYVTTRVDVESANFAFTVQRVHFLRARAQKHRWTEELLLVDYEMSWTVQFFRHKAAVWRVRGVAAAAAAALGSRSYTARKISMWEEIAWFAEGKFQATNHSYKSISS